MAQQLAFYARGDLLVSHPTARRFVGQHPRYVGRKVVAQGDGAVVLATEQPFVCDDGSEIAARLKKLCKRDASLWPANAETAAACGVAFTPVEFVDGEWIPKSTEAPKRAPAKPPKD